MSILQHGLTPKMKPVSPKRTALIAALDVGTSKVACLIARLNPFLTVWRLIGVFVAMAGTDIEVQAPDAHVVVRVI